MITRKGAGGGDRAAGRVLADRGEREGQGAGHLCSGHLGAFSDATEALYHEQACCRELQEHLLRAAPSHGELRAGCN